MSDRPQETVVTLVEDARMTARIGEHEIAFDLPEDLGGHDTAPTPTECFVTSIAACELFYAYRFLSRRGVATDGATATITWESSPKAVQRARVVISIPGGLDPSLVEGCLKMVRGCFVTQSVEAGVEITTEIG